MRNALQIVSWVAIVIGGLAIISGDGDYYAFVGGGLFLTQGVLAISYIKEVDKIKK